MEIVNLNLFGKDHWSLLAYIETRSVDHQGIPDFEHMRCNPDEHPQFAGSYRRKRMWMPSYGTRLNDGTQLENHDDWHCVDDLIEAGFITWEGSGINPLFVLTEKGERISAEIRQLKASGGKFADYKYEETLV